MKLGERAFAVGTPFQPGRRPVHYGWVIAVVGTLGMVASVPGQTIGVNVFNEKLIEALGLSRLSVSTAYFVGTAASGFLLPFAGSLFDRLGARRMIVGASVSLALSLLYMSVVDRVAAGIEGLSVGSGLSAAIRMGALVLGFFFLRFFGQGLVMMTSRNMVGKWWVAHRGKIFSVGGIAVTVCFSLAPKLFNEMIESFGWRESWRLMALALAPGFCLVAWLLYRDNPAECKLEADAAKPLDAGRADDPEFKLVREFTRAEALRSFSFWAFSLVFALQACYFTGYAFHVIDVAADLGRGASGMLDLFVPIAILNAAVSLVVGWMSDRCRLKYLLAFMALGNALAAFALVGMQGVALSVGLVVGFGVSGGCFGAISGVFMPRFFGLKHLGAISGFFASIIVIGSAVGPLAFSLARGMAGSYAVAHGAAALLALGLVATSFWADNPQRKLAR
ncbi:MFS transporter [Pelagicoccus sp. NFK12]|uniref:MFS transporter n=1 Tax=Pelagicoccus enzymogenes TaxID=2773457 RepID=A0A927F8A2_9BACT|nr:MFS transporter [Pelagicoccus enzymogenes]MBD5778758.1 MFS transporter [Pelagicoccus enzymogenes]MDQ8197495.1 MFS transporter [Pelagicoccus enzymogenes]